MLRSRFGDRYKIVGSISSGGTGRIYCALDRELKKKIALKVLAEGFGARPDVQENLINASKAAGKIGHQNIVSIYESGMAEGAAFCAMELLEGQSLRDLLAAKKSLAWTEAKAIFLGLCDALRALHNNGIVHCNISPKKIFLQGDERKVKLLDFTLAKLRESGFGKSSGYIGDPLYTSPEQVNPCMGCDHRIDVYSFGLVMYQTLTGVLPFESIDISQVLGSRLHEPITHPRDIRPGIDPAADAIIMKALESKPKDRYQTASELKTDIEKI